MKALIRTNKITPKAGSFNTQLIPVTSPDNDMHIAGVLSIDVFAEENLFKADTTYVVEIKEYKQPKEKKAEVSK